MITTGTMAMINISSPSNVTTSSLKLMSSGALKPPTSAVKSIFCVPMQLEAAEQLGEADAGHGEHEAGRVLEPTDDEELDQRADEATGHDRDRQHHPVGHVMLEHHADAQHADHAAQRAVGEVDEAVGAVDEDDAHRAERGDRAVDDADRDDAERRAVADDAGLSAGARPTRR